MEAARQPGRPVTADEKLRQNNYRDDSGRYQVTELKPWHTRVVDYMMLNPHAKRVDIAHAFGVSPQWVGMLMNSDSFKEYYAGRMGNHEQIVQNMTIQRLQSIAIKSLDVISEKLDSKEVSFGVAKDAATMALKSLDYIHEGPALSVKAGQGARVTVAIGADMAERARQRLHQKMVENGELIEHDPDQYLQVTAAMQVSQEDIPDAIEVSDNEQE